MKVLLILFLNLGLFFLFGCSTNENTPLEPDPPGDPIMLAVSSDQVYYLNLTDKAVVEVADPLLEKGWDLTIDNLTTIQLNGGSTAPGPVFASKIEEMVFDDLKTAPSVTYITDDQNGGYIGDNWYYYDVTMHTVNPLDHFYVIRAADGEFYKFKISDAVFTSRTDGELTIYIEKISTPPSYETQSTVGRTLITEITLSTLESVYFNLKEAKIVEVSDESASLEWDIKTSYLTVNLNGGTSGPGNCVAVMYEEVEFDSVSAIPADGYASDDSTISSLAIGDSWYSYNPATHTLSPVPNVYVLKTNDGHHAKLEFIAKDFPTQAEGVAVVKLHYTENTDKF
jgi:hypothetical protein